MDLVEGVLKVNPGQIEEIRRLSQLRRGSLFPLSGQRIFYSGDADEESGQEAALLEDLNGVKVGPKEMEKATDQKFRLKF